MLILEDVDYQRSVLDQLRGQVQEVQRKLSLSLIYLEALKQVSSSKGGEHTRDVQFGTLSVTLTKTLKKPITQIGDQGTKTSML